MSTKREALAKYAHDQAWSGWMKYMFSKMRPITTDTMTRDGLLLPMEFVERWTRQMDTPYDELPEKEKESDRAEADKMLAIIASFQEEEDFWNRQYKEAHVALGKLSKVIGNPCLEAKDGESFSEAFVSYVINRYIKTDDAWREIHGCSISTEEEWAIAEVIKSARTIQEFLWGEKNAVWNLEEWRRMFRKRVVKIEEVDSKNPHASVELKKRLLQTAALAVAMIGRIEREGLPSNECPEPSNLSQYSEPIEE